jgi:hypothetical protein
MPVLVGVSVLLLLVWISLTEACCIPCMIVPGRDNHAAITGLHFSVRV